MPAAGTLPIPQNQLDAPEPEGYPVQPPPHQPGQPCPTCPWGPGIWVRALTSTVLQIHPLMGPKEGGTRVTVAGENLGLASREVSLRVAGVRCTSIPTEYVSAERWVRPCGPPIPVPIPVPIALSP